MPRDKEIRLAAELCAENYTPSRSAGNSPELWRYPPGLFQTPGCDEADPAVAMCAMLGGIMAA